MLHQYLAVFNTTFCEWELTWSDFNGREPQIGGMDRNSLSSLEAGLNQDQKSVLAEEAIESPMLPAFYAYKYFRSQDIL